MIKGESIDIIEGFLDKSFVGGFKNSVVNNGGKQVVSFYPKAQTLILSSPCCLRLYTYNNKLIISHIDNALLDGELALDFIYFMKHICRENGLTGLVFPFVDNQVLRDFCLSNDFVTYGEPNKYSFIYDPASYILKI